MADRATRGKGEWTRCVACTPYACRCVHVASTWVVLGGCHVPCVPCVPCVLLPPYTHVKDNQASCTGSGMGMSRGRNEAGTRQERETCGVHQLGRDGGDPLVGRAGGGRAGNKKEPCYGAEYGLHCGTCWWYRGAGEGGREVKFRGSNH